MDGFEWGQNVLGGNTPEELQRRGLNVYVAPNVPRDTKVVDLATGRIDSFRAQEHRPGTGYYADFDSLARYCQRNGVGLLETGGVAVVQGTIHPAPVTIAVEDMPNTGSPEGDRLRDLRGFTTAYDAREYLPELAAWMSDDALRLLRIYRGARFERDQMYFDLDNPERGPFVATGEEGPITDHTYVCRAETTEDVWSQLVTWRQSIDRDQAEAIRINAAQFTPAQAPLTGGPNRPG